MQGKAAAGAQERAVLGVAAVWRGRRTMDDFGWVNREPSPRRPLVRLGDFISLIESRFGELSLSLGQRTVLDRLDDGQPLSLERIISVLTVITGGDLTAISPYDERRAPLEMNREKESLYRQRIAELEGDMEAKRAECEEYIAQVHSMGAHLEQAHAQIRQVRQLCPLSHHRGVRVRGTCYAWASSPGGIRP